MAFRDIGGGGGVQAQEALQAEAARDNAGFDPRAGRVEHRENPNIQVTQVDALGGRDMNHDQDAADERDAEARREENEEAMKVYKTMTPEEVFLKFDTDGSGYIDFDEYKAMLPQLGINIKDAKAQKYFNLADTDGSGEIDFEEFKVAMFAVDPNSGNASGFAPNSLLSPIDAFEMFDEDGSGEIDEDEFYFVLEYMGLKISDKKQDAMFAKYDTDGSGSLGYEEFKQIWLRCANVKKELDDRGLEYPKFASRAALEIILERAIDDEEEQEKKALAEAKQFKEWQALLREKKHHIYRAQRRAKVELRGALDTAGQVYTFGGGTFGQYDGEAAKEIATRNAPFKHFQEVFDIWYGRIFPDQSFLLQIGAEERKKVTADPGEADEKLEVGANLDADDPRAEVLTSFFREAKSSCNTAALWGRRIVQVALADSVAVALSDLGELYAWGGTSHWWHAIEEDSVWQERWRGDVTARSAKLLAVADRPEPVEEPIQIPEDPEETLADKFKVVLGYFSKWQPPPLPSERLKFYKDVLFPKVPYEVLTLACEVRGQGFESKTKLEMLNMLFAAIELEKRILGERAHRRLRELEEEILELRQKKKKYMAKTLIQDCQELWEPLLQMQLEEAAEKEAKRVRDRELAEIASEKKYAKWRKRTMDARLDGAGKFTPRGNSLDIPVSGFTARGNPLHTPRGYQRAVYLSCGANHAAVVHQNGHLYTWGTGGAGRLGHDLTRGGDSQGDVIKPALVQALVGRPVVRIACGYSHSAAVTVDAQLYVWGSGTAGKLGLGTAADTEECFCSVPTPVTVGNRKRVRKVSCGSVHTGCVTEDGDLYMWGCGDGGRLGLGGHDVANHFKPTRVAVLEDEKVVSLSCGSAHTLVVTSLRESYEGTGASRVKVLLGGDVYMAGAQSSLGRHCPVFTKFEGLAPLPITMVSAGFNHSAAVTRDGQVYCWGNNHSGCCGAPHTTRFCYEPVNLRCINQAPENLALGRHSEQSSVYNGLDAYLAVDGNTDGDDPNFCMSTQCEAQAWWEVDLGGYCVLHSVKLWNRDDEPSDPAFERDQFRNRLFPCYIMLSNAKLPRTKTEDTNQDLLDQQGDGEESGQRQTNLQAALDMSCARMKVTKLQRCTLWHVPNNTVARYVRIQLVGFDFLHFAQLEVFGTPGLNKPVGLCGHVECGRNVTMALVRPVTDQKDVDKAYRRAVLADSHNADILRQFETFALPYDKYGRGERIKRCLVCKGTKLCETCQLKGEFKDELRRMPLGVGGRLPTLDEMAQYLLDAPKPPLDYVPKKRKERTRLGRFAEDLGDIFGAVKHVDDASTTTGGKPSTPEKEKKSEAADAKEGDAKDQDKEDDSGELEESSSIQLSSKPKRSLLSKLFGRGRRKAKPIAPTGKGAGLPAQEVDAPSTSAVHVEEEQLSGGQSKANGPKKGKEPGKKKKKKKPQEEEEA